jgi:hypothetical protein
VEERILVQMTAGAYKVIQRMDLRMTTNIFPENGWSITKKESFCPEEIDGANWRKSDYDYDILGQKFRFVFCIFIGGVTGN